MSQIDNFIDNDYGSNVLDKIMNLEINNEFVNKINLLISHLLEKARSKSIYMHLYLRAVYYIIDNVDSSQISLKNVSLRMGLPGGIELYELVKLIDLKKIDEINAKKQSGISEYINHIRDYDVLINNLKGQNLIDSLNSHKEFMCGITSFDDKYYGKLIEHINKYNYELDNFIDNCLGDFMRTIRYSFLDMNMNKYKFTYLTDHRLIEDIRLYVKFIRKVGYKLSKNIVLKIIKFIINNLVSKLLFGNGFICGGFMNISGFNDNFSKNFVEIIKENDVLLDFDFFCDYFEIARSSKQFSQCNMLFEKIIYESTKQKIYSQDEISKFINKWNGSCDINTNMVEFLERYKIFENTEKVDISINDTKYLISDDFYLDLFGKYNITYNSEILSILCRNCYNDKYVNLIKDMLNNKFIPSDIDIMILAGKPKGDEILKILPNFGIKIEKQHYEYRRLMIGHDIDELDAYTNKYLKEYYKKPSYRETKSDKINNMKKLVNMFRTCNNRYEIDEFMKENSLAMNVECLENALLNKSGDIVNYAILNCNEKPSLLAILKIPCFYMRINMAKLYYGKEFSVPPDPSKKPDKKPDKKKIK